MKIRNLDEILHEIVDFGWTKNDILDNIFLASLHIFTTIPAKHLFNIMQYLYDGQTCPRKRCGTFFQHYNNTVNRLPDSHIMHRVAITSTLGKPMTVTFDFATPKPEKFIFVPRCSIDKCLVKIHKCIPQISQKHHQGQTDGCTDTSTHGRTHDITVEEA